MTDGHRTSAASSTPAATWRLFVFGLVFAAAALASFTPIFLFPKLWHQHAVGQVLGAAFGFQIGPFVPILEMWFKPVLQASAAAKITTLFVPLGLAYFGIGAWIGAKSRRWRRQSPLALSGFGVLFFLAAWVGMSLLGGVCWYLICLDGSC